MQNKKRKTSTLEANRALFTADENALIDKLLECGQEHLFEHWPAPGDADEDKKRFMAQAATCDAGYPGGIASYVSNARKLLEDSKLGVNPFDGWTPSVPDGIVVDYASAEHKKLEQLGMQEIGSAASSSSPAASASASATAASKSSSPANDPRMPRIFSCTFTPSSRFSPARRARCPRTVRRRTSAFLSPS